MIIPGNKDDHIFAAQKPLILPKILGGFFKASAGGANEHFFHAGRVRKRTRSADGSPLGLVTVPAHAHPQATNAMVES